MLKTVRMVLEVFQAHERRRLVALFGLFVAMALLQTVSVASILPFMSLVGNPDAISESRTLSWLYDELGFSSTRSFLFFVGLLVLGLTTFSNAFTALTQWVMLRFVWRQQYQLCVRLLSRYLAEPYEFFLSRNTSDLAKTMFVEVGETIRGIVLPGMKMLAQTVVVLSIFTLLILVDPVLAVVSTLVLGGAYGLIYTLVRREQARTGRIRLEVNSDRFRTANEALGGIKESKVLGRESAFLERFSAPTREFSRVSAKNAVITEIPRYALETVAFGGILLIVLYMLSTRDDFGQAVAVMSLYALAGYRLMPALTQIFSGLAKARFYSAALEELHADLTRAADTPERAVRTLESEPRPLALENGLVVEDLTFAYPGAEGTVLHRINLTIEPRSVVGFVGSTGSGKTTLVDLLLGLIRPQEGRIIVDDRPLTRDSIPAWQRNIGYVPQDIYLCDDSIARNIAFGLPDREIDAAAVQRAARIAQIHQFIESLPKGYSTVVGERGVRLSGGQRQRIGIARALYRDPDVLVFDEATSALDGITEDALMDAVGALVGLKTIILVAHRVTTLRDCDIIHVFSDGRIRESGTYDELMTRSAAFRAMAKAAEPEPARTL